MSAGTTRTKLYSILLPIIASLGLIVYFAVLFNLTVPQEVLPSALRYVVMPVVFTFPWILLLIIFRERTTNAWNAMKTKTNIIPLRWRMFYGFNTIVIISFFLLPFISPPLAVFAALVLAWRIVYHTAFIWEKGESTRLLYTALIFCILAAVPVYLLILWFQYFLGYIAGQVFILWVALFEPIYFVSICLVDALAVGALLHLSYGTLDMRGKVRVEKAGIVWTIRLIEAVIAVLLLVLLNRWYDPLGLKIWTFDPLGLSGGQGLIFYINAICLALVAMVYIVKFCVGIRGETDFSLVGVLFVSAFLIVEVFRSLDVVLKSALVVGSSLLFVIGFVISFFTSPDELLIESEVETEASSPVENTIPSDENESEIES